jgi:hypothetical protein
LRPACQNKFLYVCMYVWLMLRETNSEDEIGEQEVVPFASSGWKNANTPIDTDH